VARRYLQSAVARSRRARAPQPHRVARFPVPRRAELARMAAGGRAARTARSAGARELVRPRRMNWILLRGWSREARHWGDFPAQLQAALAGSASPTTVRALDLPGNGSRHLERSPARVSAMVDAVRENLGGPGKFHLLGLSLGAMACVDWAARFPGEVAACVLLSASLRPFSPFYERLRPGNLPKVAGLFLEKDAARREAGILALTSSGADAGLAPVWARYAEDRPVSRGNVLRQLVAAARFSAPLAPPPVP